MTSSSPWDTVANVERVTDRRRKRDAGQTPMGMLTELPALVILERFPVPVLAVAEHGAILFANGAFAEMLGRTMEELLAMPFRQIFHALPDEDAAVSVLRSHGGLLVELTHADGSVVRARMSKSALLRGDDPVALATFNDLTEQLWAEEL